MIDQIFKIYLSAGHGVYFNDSYKKWMTQHRNYLGIVEDFWTVLVARELFVLLDEDSRFMAFMNRDFFNEEIGESGYQKWMEGSHLFFQEVGAPQSIWNVGSGIFRANNADALGIKHYDADIAIAIHANYDDGEEFGYEVWHHSLSYSGKMLASEIQKSLTNLPTRNRGLFSDPFHDARAFWKESRGIAMATMKYM